MEDSYHKYKFSAISIKQKVAVRFRSFSRQVSGSHSETLEAMLNFFEWHELTPNDSLGIKNEGINRRINAVVAILKNIEKHQTKPTKAMLDALFHEVSTLEKEQEEDFEFIVPPTTLTEEQEPWRHMCEEAQQKFLELFKGVSYLMGKITPVKTTFGSTYLKVDLEGQEFEKLKQKLLDVYHH